MPAPLKQSLPKKSSPQGGRPCLLTPKREAALLKAIEEGLPLKQAAMLAGVSYDTLNRWRKRGESEDEPLRFRQFCKALQHAEAVAMQLHLSNISDAGKKDWKASAWILQRRFREDFGDRQEAAAEIDPQEQRRQLFESVMNQELHPVQRAILENARYKEWAYATLSKLGEFMQKHQAKLEAEREEERLKAMPKQGARLRE